MDITQSKTNQIQLFSDQQLENINQTNQANQVNQANPVNQVCQANLSKYEQFKCDVYHLIEKKTAPHGWSRAFHSFMILLISLNVTMVIMETVEEFANAYSYQCHVFELITVIIFTFEYIARLWCCNASDKWKGNWGRLKFVLSPMMIIDLLAIIPFFIPMFISADLLYLRVIRLTRIFRLFKLGHYSRAFDVINNVIIKKREYLVLSFLFMFIILTFSASLMYIVEHDAQPGVFSSIPHTMWWGVVTMTSVGYGDICPVTPIGKFLTSIIAVIGVAMFALPAAILSAGFFEELQEKKVIHCPHCGQDIEEDA